MTPAAPSEATRPPQSAAGPRPEPPRRRVRPTPSPVTGRVSPSSALVARPLLAVLPVLAFLVPALILGFGRNPVYTGEARLLVGGFDVPAQAVPGFVEASRTLAQTYGRLVETDAIVEPVADALRLPVSEVRGHISASAIPESGIIRVLGTHRAPERAVRFAATAAEALVEYADPAGADRSEEVLEEYEDATTALRLAEAEEARLAEAVRADGGTTASADLRAQLAEAEAASARARLEAESIANRYQRSVESGGSSGRMQLVAAATDQGSDRRSVLQFAVGASIVLGVVAGIALVTLVVNREVAAAQPRLPRNQ